MRKLFRGMLFLVALLIVAASASARELGTFGPVWRLPTSVIQPGFFKFQVRYDF